MSADEWKIQSIQRAYHLDAAGEKVASENRYGKPIWEITLIHHGDTLHDYMQIAGSYKKTDTGFELSRFGVLVAAATDVTRPATAVHQGVLIGRSVRVLLEADENGKQKITGYRSARV
jgi:hypothetical protein